MWCGFISSLLPFPYLEPPSVTYNSFSSSENARPLGRVKPSATASTMPDPGAIRYIWFCTRGFDLCPFSLPYVVSVNQTEPSRLTTTSLGLLKGTPNQLSATIVVFSLLRSRRWM
ncbi:hypothetical protein KC19_7G020600 [Ceratodon purpureus]|uniref:Uncharacterized protein n=1 Tax=Ceratodon purpureus TaxID=3225 RepID=A0A8T0H9V5_CERPU|nr:hypothetical protein KC19_7G020600 [Ceratodon purpureus]